MPERVRRNFRKIKNFLSKEQTKILETAFVLMLPALISKVTGLVFKLVTASYYGTEDLRYNQFLVASAIPELLTGVLLAGALGAVTIPLLISAKEKNGKEAFYSLFSSILNSTILIFTVIALFLIIFAEWFIPFAISLSGAEQTISPDQILNIANMMRALVVPQLLLGISVYISSGLNVYNRFLVPQLSQLFYNIGRVLVVFIIVPLMDFSPWALVIAVYVGSLLHLAVQLPLFFTLDFKYLFKIDLKDSYLHQVWKLGLPRIVVLASDQIAFAVNKFLSLVFIGGPAALDFAHSIYMIIPNLFGFTFSYASYPTISRLFVEENFKKIRSIVVKTVNEMFFLSIPIVVVILVMRVPIVRLFFGLLPGTQLSLDGTYQVAWVLLGFGFGLVFITARWFIFSLFYASKDTILPSIVSLVSFISVIGLSIGLTNLFSYNTEYALEATTFSIHNFFNRADIPLNPGVGGISFAMSIVYSIEFLVMLVLFNFRKVNIGLKKLFNLLGRKIIAGGFMFLFVYFTFKIWDVFSYALPERAIEYYGGSTTFNLIVLSTITVVPGFMIYFLICHLLKVEELKILRKYLNPIFKLGGLYIQEEKNTGAKA